MSNVRALMFVGLVLALAWAMRQAAGKLAPKAGIGALFFLVSRWPFLIAWIAGAAVVIGLLLPGAVAKGKDSLGDFATLAGIAVLCGGGFAALAVGPVFMLARAFTAPPTLELEPGEEIRAEMSANHFLHGESRGGHVLLTDRRLAFRPHRFNVQLDTWSANLEHIHELAQEGTRFLVLTVGDRRETEWIVVSDPASLTKKILATRA